MSVMRGLKMILTLVCEESSRLTSESFDRRLGWTERIALAIHMAICRSCRRFRRHLRMMEEAFIHLRYQDSHDPLVPTGTLSAEARQRIKDALGG
jgi:hypothetical protein